MLSPSQTLSGMLGLVLILACGSAHTKPGWDPVGLAAYTETSRDIYIAALLRPVGANQEKGLVVAGARAMEYRIATPRVSKRGFASMILLQAELGSGTRAEQEATDAFQQLRRSLKGQLIKGDQFIIELSADNATSFYLNNAMLFSVQGRAAFDFFVAGWIGESSSKLLRDSLLAPGIDPTLLARYQSLHPDQQRIAAIDAWVAPPPVVTTSVATSVATSQQSLEEATKQEPAQPQPTLATADAVNSGTDITEGAALTPKPTPVTETELETEPLLLAGALAVKTAAGGSDATEAPEVAAVASSTVVAGTENDTEVKVAVAVETEAVTEPGGNTSHTSVASIQPVPEEPVANNDAQSVSVAANELYKVEYQARLDKYMNHVMKKVFGNVNYPRRAINKQRQGKVELLAHLDKSGELLDVTLDNSSGYTTLDNAARKAVREAAPFPELPPEVLEEFAADDGESYVVMIPVTFKLLK